MLGRTDGNWGCRNFLDSMGRVLHWPLNTSLSLEWNEGVTRGGCPWCFSRGPMGEFPHERQRGERACPCSRAGARHRAGVRVALSVFLSLQLFPPLHQGLDLGLFRLDGFLALKQFSRVPGDGGVLERGL